MVHDKSANVQPVDLPEHCTVLVGGAGISGICLAAQMVKQGIKDFLVLEQSSDVGGTWLDNTYPGCGCDVPSMLYSFSFALNRGWTRKYAPQAEILQYFKNCIERFSLKQHIHFGVSIASAHWDDLLKRWLITTATGAQISCDYFVTAVGQLSRPSIPSIAGIETFDGPLFHSARWEPGFDPQGKTISLMSARNQGVEAAAERFTKEGSPCVYTPVTESTQQSVTTRMTELRIGKI